MRFAGEKQKWIYVGIAPVAIPDFCLNLLMWDAAVIILKHRIIVRIWMAMVWARVNHNHFVLQMSLMDLFPIAPTKTTNASVIYMIVMVIVAVWQLWMTAAFVQVETQGILKIVTWIVKMSVLVRHRWIIAECVQEELQGIWPMRILIVMGIVSATPSKISVVYAQEATVGTKPIAT